MRFLHKDKISKTVLIISDLHLGAGVYIDRRRNNLEGFHYDKEFVEFLKYYSTGEYANRNIELIINGDFLDLLAVPYVKYFDDEYWSEKASLERLKIILKAHPEVFNALGEFLKQKKRKLIYILGNHDAELVLESLRKHFIHQFPEDVRRKVHINFKQGEEYSPAPGIVVKHGHEYELAHKYSSRHSTIEDSNGNKYFIPPWGSYYITSVLNKFKSEKSYVDSVRPVKKFLIYGIIFDTVFTLRFALATAYYFFIVRFVYFFKISKNYKKIVEYLKSELELFKDYETLTEDYIEERDDIKALIVGHTHMPIHRSYPDGSCFVNTGSWTQVYRLDFNRNVESAFLTFAQIDFIKNGKAKKNDVDNPWNIALNAWKGASDLPYVEY